jgi:hypothetical protein
MPYYEAKENEDKTKTHNSDLEEHSDGRTVMTAQS